MSSQIFWGPDLNRVKFDVKFTETINQCMQVPNKLQILEQSTSQVDGVAADDQPLSFQMRIPERISLAGVEMMEIGLRPFQFELLSRRPEFFTPAPRGLSMHAPISTEFPSLKTKTKAGSRTQRRQLERTRGGSTSNQEIDENTELGKENLCQLAKGDHVLLRNFNRKWNQQRFTGPHLVEDVSTRAVKLKDKRAWNHLHDVKIYKLQTRPSANDRSIGKTPTTSPAAEENTTTDNDPIVPSERITDEEGGDPHTAHPMVTRSKSKTAPAI
ncbi:mitochondrial fission factor homolog A-like isoform X3 [Ambystoma mexicanum]|uniref:mitochondrial fission factor homolog A-like isoform X3 n=1 Tax=Ambystoma mexicanum TaxID=8296 RepID=UPI0037E743F3